MNLQRCDVCGKLGDYRDVRRWRTLEIREAKGWIAVNPDDWWPGYECWFDGHEITVHFCSEECMFTGLTRLHHGSSVVAFAGFTIPSEALLAHMREPAA